MRSPDWVTELASLLLRALDVFDLRQTVSAIAPYACAFSFV